MKMLTLPKSKRLTRPAQFAQVKAEGVTHRAGALVLGVLPGNGEVAYQVGFVTSKRLGNAVVRNRVRRRLREVVRVHQMRILPGTWLVLIARPSAAQATLRELEHDWLRLAERASILAPA